MVNEFGQFLSHDSFDNSKRYPTNYECGASVYNRLGYSFGITLHSLSMHCIQGQDYFSVFEEDHPLNAYRFCGDTKDTEHSVFSLCWKNFQQRNQFSADLLVKSGSREKSSRSGFLADIFTVDDSSAQGRKSSFRNFNPGRRVRRL